MANGNHAWPYPRNRKDLRHVTTIIAAACIIGLIAAGVQYHRYTTKQLDGDNMQQAAESLGSYAGEAAVLADQSARSRSLQNYTVPYFRQLHEEAAETTDFIDSHAAPAQLDQSARRLVQYGRQLETALLEAARQPDKDHFRQAEQTFERLQADAAKLENAK